MLAPFLPRPWRALAVAAAVAVAGAGCATTTDAGAPGAPLPAGASTTTVPAVDDVPDGIDAQLETIVELAAGLGDEIYEDGSEEDVTFARVQAIWAVAGPVVAENDTALHREFEHSLGILADGVSRNRPADADKASRNLRAVTDTYLARHPA